MLVPRSLLASQLERPDAVHGLIIDGAAPQGQILRDHLVNLKGAVGRLSPESVHEAVEATISLTAACLNGITRAAQGKPVAPALPLLPRIKQYIMENLHDRTLSPETIAYRQGLPQAKLYEMFESDGGVFTYMRVMRLKAAFDALRDPHQAWRPIHEIALEAGYSSDAFFCRAFESMFDVTPIAVRRAGEMAIPKLAPRPEVDRRYEEWLRSLGPFDAKRGAAAGERQQLFCRSRSPAEF
jgi:AraC-like DNA-binding protein